ncbi:Asp-tRNAAsn/Glu-tRNAGln amidotransferase A subunit family amidase [Hoeflea halophila]|uniref:Asp-tRNAAsn/Glu-tRNAGln amidotransferase A subunit family amidase n=1 Tax=Hoeflea halophila TaxID=714899 RepID=A0A286HVE6_9HYPH|nr:amidase [Hoeflea halophila]SOE11677.1 Asp-tRNAAsn/Glu-tRNAGln amidotransferase A subunit family amidase [Hoeflea halophila]
MDTNRMMSLASLIKARDSGKAKPELMVALCRDAIARNDDRIRAFTHLAPPSAVPGDGPLAGVAIGVKDIFDSFDQPTTFGSIAYEGFQPLVDAAIVELARRRGASIIGKTATTEFAFFSPAPTVNPRNPAHTPGGSSSGSAAAVAAGMIPAAIGTQTGGSVVRPAAFCGVTGYKPSFRLLPTTGMKHFSPSLDTVGLFAAGVEDVALLAALLTGRDLAVPGEFPGFDPANIRVGLYRCAQLETADPAMRSALERAADLAADAGFDVGEIGEPEALARARDAHKTIQDHEAGLACGPDLARYREQMSQVLVRTIEAGQAIAPSDYDAARRRAKHGRNATSALFREVDILLTPSAPGAAPLGLETTGDPRFNKLWTLMGTPAINIPGFRDEAGMPLGIQAVARFGQDKTLLAVAAMLERAFRA